MKNLKLRIVFAVARALRVPIDIHGSFFAVRKNEAKTSGCLTAPK
jgi:hypothetical protein